jgi:glycosyltransferase involved in cell wall biosynthesis
VGLADESIPAALVYPSGCEIEGIVSGPIELISHPSLNLPLVRGLTFDAVVERLERFKPTVLHCLCESRAAFVRRLASRLDLPYILTVNSLSNELGRMSISANRCAKIVAPTRSIAARIREMQPRFADRVEQISIGIFVDESIECFDNPSHLPSMVAAQSLDNAGDFRNLFGAIKDLTIAGYEFMLVVMGTGRAEQPVWKLVADFGLQGTIVVVPKLKPSRPVLAAADIFIQPKPASSFNMFLLEAMSVGTAAAVCTGGVDDLIIPEQTAVVFDPHDRVSIKATLQRLLDNHEFARQLARASQKYVKDNHSVSAMISAMLEAYRQAQRA